MGFQAYLDNIKAKTGMTPDDFLAAAKKKGMLKDGVTATEIMDWLKADYDLGHGHSGAVYRLIKDSQSPELSIDARVDKHFAGAAPRSLP